MKISVISSSFVFICDILIIYLYLLVKYVNFQDNGEFERKRTSSRAPEREFMRGNDSFGGNEFREPQFNTYGLNPEFLKSLGINGPLNNKVFISNVSNNRFLLYKYIID